MLCLNWSAWYSYEVKVSPVRIKTSKDNAETVTQQSLNKEFSKHEVVTHYSGEKKKKQKITLIADVIFTWMF